MSWRINPTHTMNKSSNSTPMTQTRASAIQSDTARSGNGQVSSSSFAARATRAAAINSKSGGGKSK